jgi:hypothetical protein
MKVGSDRPRRVFRKLAIAAALLAPATYAFAVPVTYTFSTGPAVAATTLTGFNQPLLDALSGLSVTGSFTYDSEVPLTDVTDGPVVFGQANYAGAMSNVSGSLGALPFAGTLDGFANVANEGYAPPVPGFVPKDFLQVAQVATGVVLDGLGLRQIDARFFWIEGLDVGQGPIADFLSDSTLPAQLPGFQGRLAIDFLSVDAQPGDFSSITFAFFDGLEVKPVAVAEPGSLPLALTGALLLIAVVRTRRPRVPLGASRA